jgi:hypothetical protein
MNRVTRRHAQWESGARRSLPARVRRDGCGLRWSSNGDRWLLNLGEEFIFTRLWRWGAHRDGHWLET